MLINTSNLKITSRSDFYAIPYLPMYGRFMAEGELLFHCKEKITAVNGLKTKIELDSSDLY